MNDAAAATYDRIGPGYAHQRRPDPRWRAAMDSALEGVRTLVNVGAGSGSYEPRDRRVIAVEPSLTMILQRAPDAAPVIRAVAEALPFADDRFDAALAVLTVHHWQDTRRGLREMQRVARRQVVLTWDPEVFARTFWLVRDYLPEAVEREAALATLGGIVEALPARDVRALPVPADCVDGFLGAFWQRPAAYLDGGVRAAMSGLALLDQDVVTRAMARLRRDLDNGTWSARNAHLLDLPELDLGYRLVVAER